MALNPVGYQWAYGQKTLDTGFLAQEVAAICPHAVRVGDSETQGPDETGFEGWQIDPSKLVVDLTAALQVALKRIDELEARMEGS